MKKKCQKCGEVEKRKRARARARARAAGLNFSLSLSPLSPSPLYLLQQIDVFFDARPGHLKLL
jgi:hypothetical protein